jgi:gliding motility-associated-like protein
MCPIVLHPNGDGLNDIFRPEGFGIKSFSILIYNRWGQCLADIHEGWDGMFDGKPAGPGVYFYKITFSSDFDKLSSRSGTVTLMR